MNTRQIKLKQKIARSHGIAESEAYFGYQYNDPAPFGESAQALMREVPPSFGSCVMLSCAWASYLKDHFSIPAIVVAGDLKISGARIFKYKEKLPEPSGKGKFVQKSWSGHCWIEVNGYLGDLSIFRTAYSISGRSMLKDYILNRFGPSRGALLSPVEGLPEGIQYIPQYVLKDAQVDMFTASLGGISLDTIFNKCIKYALHFPHFSRHASITPLRFAKVAVYAGVITSLGKLLANL